MTRKIHFIRHAQTSFNVVSQAIYRGETPEDHLDSYKFVDTKLTDFGKKQAAEIRDKIKDLGIDIAICSPFQRALQTCLIAYGGENVLITDLCRERMSGVCDIGTAKDKLGPMYPALDFSAVETNIWWYSGSLQFRDQEEFLQWFKSDEGEIESEEDLASRAAKFNDFLKTRSEKSIAVFSHSHFLRKFLNWHFNRPLEYIENGDIVSLDLPDA